MNWDENPKAMRADMVGGYAEEMEKAHGVDLTELAKQHSRCTEARDGIQVKRVKRLLYTLDPPKPLSIRLQEQLMGSDGLRHLVAAMVTQLIDYGGTAPWATCEQIAEDAPSLYRVWDFRQVLDMCEEIQHSEIPEQSRLYQRMFQKFTTRSMSPWFGISFNSRRGCTPRPLD
jgi:hypothetical protein